MLTDIHKKFVGLLSENASALLTAGGVVGTVTTALLTGRATFKAADVIDQYVVEQRALNNEPLVTSDFDRKTKIKLVWPLYIPPFLTGGATIGSIILANRMSSQKAAALAAAYGLSERQLREYKEKVSERLTGPKEQAIKDEIRQDRVSQNDSGNVIIVASGEVLCYDMASDRYFNNTVEGIKRAENEINNEILGHNYASMNEFYDRVGLKPTLIGGELGWTSTVPLDIEFSTVMSPDGRPCIAIEFVNSPVENYHKAHTY